MATYSRSFATDVSRRALHSPSDLEIVLRTLFEGETLEDVVSRHEFPALRVVPKLRPSGFEFGKAREAAATTLVPIRDRGNGREDNLVRIIRWILARTAAIPCEDRYTTREALLVCDTLSLMLAQKNHYATSCQRQTKVLFTVVTIAYFEKGSSRLLQESKNW